MPVWVTSTQPLHDPTFATKEVESMIADRYLERRFREGMEAGRQESRQHIRETLEKAGIELPPEVREQLFGSPDRKAGDK